MAQNLFHTLVTFLNITAFKSLIPNAFIFFGVYLSILAEIHIYNIIIIPVINFYKI